MYEVSVLKACAVVRGLVVNVGTAWGRSVRVEVDAAQLEMVPVHTVLERWDLVQLSQVLTDKSE